MVRPGSKCAWLAHETVWLSQKAMADLFQTTKQNISQHLQTIYEDGELHPEATVKKYLTVQTEGNREVSRTVDHYNLDAILAVGYRVRSHRGTQFRIWATTKCEERRGKCENGFPRAFVRFCIADRPCLSGTRSLARRHGRHTTGFVFSPNQKFYPQSALLRLHKSATS